MTVTFDPSTDFETVADGLETVTLLRRGSSNSVAITHALQRALRIAEIVASDGKYRAGDVRWHVPAVEITVDPRLGDSLVDTAGNRYVILDKEYATLEVRWRLVCRNLAIAYGLDDTVSVLRATWSKGDGGAAEPAWNTWKTGIRARIQPLRIDPQMAHESRFSAKQFEIYLGEDVLLDHSHRIQDSKGVIYKVIKSEGQERIGELQAVLTEVTPWPLS